MLNLTAFSFVRCIRILMSLVQLPKLILSDAEKPHATYS